MPTAHQILLKKLKEESEKQYPKKNDSKKNGKLVENKNEKTR